VLRAELVDFVMDFVKDPSFIVIRSVVLHSFPSMIFL
jgi:hypothetical protein